MERRTFTFEQQSAQPDFIVQENEFLIWYDTIIIIKVDQKLSDLFQGTHSQIFNKVKKRLWPSPLLKLKACFFRHLDVVPPQRGQRHRPLRRRPPKRKVGKIGWVHGKIQRKITPSPVGAHFVIFLLTPIPKLIKRQWNIYKYIKFVFKT